MIKAIVSDFSRVLLFPKDKTYLGSLNTLHKEQSEKIGYNPLNYFELNQELLNLYASLKDKYPIYIFTSDSIQNAAEFQPYLKPVFKEIVSAKELKTDKKLSDAYRIVAKNIGFTPDEILYIDDSLENIKSAKNAGCNTLLYSDYEILLNKLRETLSS